MLTCSVSEPSRVVVVESMVVVCVTFSTSSESVMRYSCTFEKCEVSYILVSTRPCEVFT